MLIAFNISRSEYGVDLMGENQLDIDMQTSERLTEYDSSHATPGA